MWRVQREAKHKTKPPDLNKMQEEHQGLEELRGEDMEGRKFVKGTREKDNTCLLTGPSC